MSLPETPKRKPVDLDALALELTAAGLNCHIEDESVFADTPKKKNQIQRRWRITSFGHVHTGKLQWGEWVPSGTQLLDDWKYLDIIRKHVEAV